MSSLLILDYIYGTESIYLYQNQCNTIVEKQISHSELNKNSG